MPENKFMVSDVYVKSIQERTDFIKKINLENKIYQRLRERNDQNPTIKLACSEILFENVQMIDYLMKGIAYDRARIKELG